MGVKVEKAPGINLYDGVELNRRFKEFALDSINEEGRDLCLIYFYQLPRFREHGVKVGMTTCHPKENFWNALKKRIKSQEEELALREDDRGLYGEVREVLHWGIALDSEGKSFDDHRVHDAIRESFPGTFNKQQEWFQNIQPERLVAVFEDFRKRKPDRQLYSPRPKQRECIQALKRFFDEHPNGERFLLNCKMRFGKSFTTYKYAEEAGIERILILTFVPAVENSWETELFHIAKHYDYFTDKNLREESFDLSSPRRPFVLFLSLQNLLGKGRDSAMKERFRKLRGVHFDLVVLDEYHFGAWNDRTKEVFEDLDPDYQKALSRLSADKLMKELRIEADRTICLSGTPFKAIASGEFTTRNTFTYSYFDEQMLKYPDPSRPSFVEEGYKRFPDMKIYGYNMSAIFPNLEGPCRSEDKILHRNYFSLNEFFRTEKSTNYTLEDRFVHEGEVRYWLDVIKGRAPSTDRFPYADPNLLKANRDTLWLLPTVSACKAMAALLRNDWYFSRYRIINLSDGDVGAGEKAYRFLTTEMKALNHDGTKSNGTIAITVNKLTIGITVKEWGGVLVLKDLTSPESYFQAIFRIQNPFQLPGGEWRTCGYVYDFNIDRAAMLLLRYAEQYEETNPLPNLNFVKLIVRYIPIYLNGNMERPITEDVFLELARFGDTKGLSLSRKITDTSRTTRILDDETIGEMLQDPDIPEILKKTFAHAKLKPSKSRARAPVPDEGSTSREAKFGIDQGYQLGMKDSPRFRDFDDFKIQEEFDDALKEYLLSYCPNDYDEIQTRDFTNGFSKGYERGVNAPIRKLQCGKQDGVEFVEEIRKTFGPNIHWTEETKRSLEAFVRAHLNKEDSIPENCRSALMKRWYCDSFRRAVRTELAPRKEGSGDMSVDDIENILRHILSRLLQFLYISVYRETTFAEIFLNADPYVFLSAVGITKEQFEKLNSYHIFQETILNKYIKEFFQNESLGGEGNEDRPEEDQVGYRRNSFNWFGFGIEEGS